MMKEKVTVEAKVTLSVLAWLVLLIAVAATLRILPLLQGQFMDVQTMQEYVVIRQGIINPSMLGTDSLSGFAQHLPYAEQGIVTIPVYLYWLTGGVLGIAGSIYLLKTLLIILTGIVVYLFAKEMTNSSGAGLFAVFLYAFLQAAIFAQAYSSLLPSEISPIMLMASLLALLYALRQKKHAAALYMFASLAALAISIISWNGGLVAAVIYIICVASLAAKHYVGFNKAIIGMLAAVAALWAALLTLPSLHLFNAYNNLAAPTLSYLVTGGSSLPALMDAIGQLQITTGFGSGLLTPLISGNPLPFVWVAASFLSSIFLAIVTMVRYRTGTRSEQQNRAFMFTIAAFAVLIPFAYFIDFSYITYLPVVILAGAAPTLIKDIRRKRALYWIGVVGVVISFAFTSYAMLTFFPHQSIDSAYHSALAWVAANTPANSTFLTDGTDGTAIEWWGNRTSLTDCCLSNNPGDVYNFSHFLFARYENFTYLDQVRPNYVLVRGYWVTASQYLLAGGGYPINRSINYTNLVLLSYAPNTIQGNTINGNEITLQRVYLDCCTVIYKVET